MFVSTKYIFQLCFSCFISLQSIWGIHINLTRRQIGDYFSNPYDDNKFCLLTNSICIRNFPNNGDKCRTCGCNVFERTFNLTSLRCVSNRESLNRGECSLRFGGGFLRRFAGELFLLEFDLTKSGQQSIKNLPIPSAKKYERLHFDVDEVTQMSSSGYEIVSSHTFGTGSIDTASDTFYLTWSKADEGQPIHGRVFRITFRYEYKNPGNINGVIVDCIMLKSTGTVQIYHPGLPKGASSSVLVTTAMARTPPSPSPSPSLSSLSLSPSTSSPSISPSSPSLSPSSPSLSPSSPSLSPSSPSLSPSSPSQSSPSPLSPSSSSPSPSLPPPSPSPLPSPSQVENIKLLFKNIPPARRPTDSISTIETSISTEVKETKTTRKPTEPSSRTVSSRIGPTVVARNNYGSGGGNNAVTVSLAVVCCLLLLGVVALVVLWLRRRSAKSSKDKNTEICLTNGNVEPENIYAEVGSSIYSPRKGEVNYEYDYADGNLRNYASLDMTKVESKPIYQSLINVQKDLHEHTPSEGAEKSIAEPFYHVVEGAEEPQDPGQIYHVLEEPEKTDNCETQDAPGRTGHENPVYSTLEEENAAENCDREVSEETGDDNPERIYSVLEDENAESDMTTQQATSDYEQRVNQLVPDAN